jgi:hypothetical protein
VVTINAQYRKIRQLERECERNKNCILHKETELHNAYKKLNDAENYLILEIAKSDGLTAANKQLENQLKIKQQIIEKLERKLKDV